MDLSEHNRKRLDRKESARGFKNESRDRRERDAIKPNYYQGYKDGRHITRDTNGSTNYSRSLTNGGIAKGQAVEVLGGRIDATTRVKPQEETTATPKKEELGKIKFVYSVSENGKDVFYVGGYKKEPFKVGELPSEIGEFREIYISNLDKEDFALDIRGSEKLASWSSKTKQFVPINATLMQPRTGGDKTLFYQWCGKGFWQRLVNSFNDSNLPPEEVANANVPNDILEFNGRGSFIALGGIKKLFARNDKVFNNDEFGNSPYLQRERTGTITDIRNYDVTYLQNEFYYFNPNNLRKSVTRSTNYKGITEGNPLFFPSQRWLYNESNEGLIPYIIPNPEDVNKNIVIYRKTELTASSTQVNFSDGSPATYNSSTTTTVSFVLERPSQSSKTLVSSVSAWTFNSYTGIPTIPDFSQEYTNFKESFEDLLFQTPQAFTDYFTVLDSRSSLFDAIETNFDEESIEHGFDKFTYNSLPSLTGELIKEKVFIPANIDTATFYHASYNPGKPTNNQEAPPSE